MSEAGNTKKFPPVVTLFELYGAGATTVGEKVADAKDLSRKIAAFAPGTKASLTVWRDGKEKDVSFEVGRQPAA